MRYILLYSVLFILNIALYGSPLNLIITIPLILYVLYLIVKGDLSKALFYHLIFIVTSVSHVAVGDFDGAITPYGYFSFKLFGPITLSYVINIVMFISYFVKRKLYINKSNLFHQLFWVFVVFALCGNIIGIIGLIAWGYSIKFFITYNVYIFNLIFLMCCMLCEKSTDVKNKGKRHLYYILLAGVISSFILFITGSRMEYGGVEVVTKPDVFTYSFILIASLAPNSKQKTNILIIILYLIVIMLGGASGKDFVFISISLLYVFRNYLKANLLKATVIVISCVLPILYILSSGMEFNQLFNDKFNQFTSLFQVFNGNLDEVARSPYIRIASMINIYTENLLNPVYFLIGRGYGGYFTDSLGLFSGIDLYLGAFSPDKINSGHFYFAHGSLAIIPLLHGFGGMLLIGIMVYKFVKRSKYDYYYLVVLPWLFLMFYYNILLAITGLFILYISDGYEKTDIQK